ncbi:uncharacterized protein LOC130451857 [Diorhabda sublineata]|uniref:uncharacterized protein LOC130451857 n=1 Tax=Diorhabda sublineata TaxID=1163346 RepID=UPI0024E13106|nr:uncharacterized protein LOC130451857 [Diorhabda sublineata]
MERLVKRPKTIRFTVFKGICPEYPNAPITLTNIQFNSINRTFLISMKINIKRNVHELNLKLHLQLKRCRSNDALDTCENYTTIKIKNFCSVLVDKGKPWTPFRKFMYPIAPECPAKKGEYEVRNGTFDGSAFNYFPISNFYWKVKALILNEQEEVILCTKVEGQIAPI